MPVLLPLLFRLGIIVTFAVPIASVVLALSLMLWWSGAFNLTELTIQAKHFWFADTDWSLVVVYTLLCVCISTVVALSLGLSTSIFLREYSYKRNRQLGHLILRMMAGVPIIIYGLLFAQLFYKSVEGSPLLVRVVLAGILWGLVTAPLMAALLTTVLRRIPTHHIEAVYALGATPTQVVQRVLLPLSRNGIIIAFLQGFSRSMAEVLLLAILLGWVQNIFLGFFIILGIIFLGYGTAFLMKRKDWSANVMA